MKVAQLMVLSAALAAASVPAVTPACVWAGAPQRADKAAGEPFSVTATIRYIELEGGFYGIFSDDGRRFDPLNLPREYAADGLRVKVAGRTVPDRLSFHMWGTVVQIESIARISP